jgi:hypothetical protein
MKQFCVIDGQGGGIGSAIIKKIRDILADDADITALGTNAIATAQMLKARANRGASGENAIVRTVVDMDAIIGPLGIVMAHALMGEVTPVMAEAIAGCCARKILIPLSQENVAIVGLEQEPLPHLLETLIAEHLQQLIDS